MLHDYLTENYECEILMTRPTDVYMSLKERTDLANNWKADYFISLHSNAGSIDSNGYEDYVYPGVKQLTKDIRNVIHNKVSKVWTDVGRENRGKKEKNLHVLRETKMPAVLLENGFLADEKDAALLKDSIFRKKLVKAIAEGLADGLKLIKKDIGQSVIYRVQVGAYEDRLGAEAMLTRLRQAGFNADIVEAKLQDIAEKDLQSTKPLSRCYEAYYSTVIETNPDNVYVAPLPGVNLRQFGIYGINGTWQDTPNAANPASIWGIAGNKNKNIGPNSYQNSPKGHKKGTLVYYEDGTLEVVRINNIKELAKPFKWCVGGGSLLPYYNPVEEGIAEDILRTTYHTGIGFIGDRVFMVVTDKPCSLEGFREQALCIGLHAAIFLDGGDSSQMNYMGNKGRHSTRPLSHGVFLKEV